MKHFYLLILVAVAFVGNTFTANAQNLFPEGDFESGIGNWDPKFRGDAAGEFTTTDVAFSGSAAGLINVTAADPTLNKVKIISPTITEGVKDNASYRFSFVAKSDVADNEFRIQFVTYTDGGDTRYMSSPSDDNGDYYHLTTEYKTYKYIGINREGYNASADFSLQCAKYVSKYYIDDIKIEPIEGIEDGSFEDGDLYYAYSPDVNTTSGTAAEFSLDTENALNGSNALKVAVLASDDTASHVSIAKQENFFPEVLKEYEFSFYAKSSGSNDSIFSAINYYDGVTTLLYTESKGFKLTEDYQQYKVLFTMPDTIHSVRFRLNLGKQVSTIYIDDLEVKEATETPNDLPVALADSFEVDKNTDLIGDVSVNDTLSTDGDNIFAVTSDPAHGTVIMQTDGNFTYKPGTDFVGNDSFTYSLCDGDNDCSSATVYVNVNIPLGAEKTGKSSFKCYPNPATSTLNVVGVKNGTTVDIINIAGIVVISRKADSNTMIIDANDLVQGTYLLRSGENITKFIKR